MKTVLVVDDEVSIRESVRMILKGDYQVRLVSSGEQALREVGESDIDLVILNLLMPGLDGFSTLKAIKKKSRADVLILTAVRKIRTAVEAMRLGAIDYLVKPFDTDELQLIVDRIMRSKRRDEQLDYLMAEIERSYPTERIVALSQTMKGILAQVARVAPLDSSVLITGERGTGKELISRVVHRQSRRSGMPFISVHCAAIPEGNSESEIFGQEKSGRRGMFELADGGTLFLDEMGDIPPPVRDRMVRAIEEGEFMCSGGRSRMKADIRLIAATCRDAGDRAGETFFRLNASQIHVPPLRDRREDIELLVEQFLTEICHEMGMPSRAVSQEALRMLAAYSWPGNVRELRNVLERAVALNQASRFILPEQLNLMTGKGKRRSLYNAERELCRNLVLNALKDCSWNQTKAARKLRISRRVLKYRMDRIGLRPRIKKGRPPLLYQCAR